MNYVYIDESSGEGRLGKYLIFASITTEDSRRLEKVIKKLWRAKPQFHLRGEFHAAKLDDGTRRRILFEISKLDLVINYKVIDKNNLHSSFSYSYYVELSRFISMHSIDRIIMVDKKDSNQTRKKIIKRLGLEQEFTDVMFEESHNVKQLQAIDAVAWSLGRMYEHNDPSFYEIISDKESPLL